VQRTRSCGHIDVITCHLTRLRRCDCLQTTATMNRHRCHMHQLTRLLPNIASPDTSKYIVAIPSLLAATGASLGCIDQRRCNARRSFTPKSKSAKLVALSLLFSLTLSSAAPGFKLRLSDPPVPQSCSATNYTHATHPTQFG
jgi:hypothetical protein